MALGDACLTFIIVLKFIEHLLTSILSNSIQISMKSIWTLGFDFLIIDH